MATLTSKLIVSLIDGVTAPAGKAVRGLLGIPAAARQANGQMTTFGQRMKVAIEANNAALDNARGRMVEAVAGAYMLKRGFDMTAGAAMSLEDKMADIAKVSGMSVTELKDFEKVLRRMATSEIPLAVEELGDLAAAASQSGIANADLEEFTRMVAKSAVAWDMSGAAAGESLAKIKTALGLTIPETEAYADVINFLSDSTASSAEDLVEFSRRVAADGKIAGFSKEEVLALGAAMISMGAQSDVAATSLRNAGKMLSRGEFGAKKSQIEAFKLLGFSAEKVAKSMQADASGTLLTVLEEISKAEPHKQLALMSGIFGDEARALMPLLANLNETRASIEAVGDSTNYLGSVQKEFETRSKTGRYALQKFSNQLRDVAIVIGQSLLPGMKVLLEAMAPYIAAVAQWMEQNPQLVAGIFAAVSALIGLRIAISAITFGALMLRGGILGAISIMGGLVKAVGFVGGAIRALTAILMANPIGLAVAAIAASVYLIYNNWEGVVAWFERLWENVKAYFSGFYDFLAGVFTGDMSRAIDGLKVMWEAFKAFWGTIWDGIAGTLTAIWTDLIKPITDALGVTDFIVAGWEMAKAGLSTALEGIGSAFSTMWSYVSPIIDGLKWVWDNAAALGGKIKEMAPEWMGGSGEAPGTGGYSGGQMGPIKPRAAGGPVTAGRTYLVGEEGPELVTPSKGGYVHPNGSGIGAGGGAQITIAPVFHINGAQEDAETIARRAMAIIDRETKNLFGGLFADTGLRTSG